MKTDLQSEATLHPTDAALADWRALALQLEQQIGRVMVGQSRAIRLLVLAVFCRGHVLLEGNVGVGKTTLLQSFARALGGNYERIEGTIDLMPNDLLYYPYIEEQGRPRVAPGPLLKHGEGLAVFFFNEVNRARPQLHSLLLRVMAERSVTAFNREYRLPHLQVFADRNQIEREETFEIPAAARDRFLMEILIEAPDAPELERQLMFDPRFHDVAALIDDVQPSVLPYMELGDVAAAIQKHVRATETLETYALDLCRATVRPSDFGVRLDGIETDRLVQAGVSPRGRSMLMRAARAAAWLAGRDVVLPEDLQEVFFETVAHRVFLNPVYTLQRPGIAAELTRGILQHVAAP